MKRAIMYSLGLILLGLIANAQIYTPYGQIQGSSGYPGANGGNLGIGLNSPQARLHINADASSAANAFSPPLAFSINSTRVLRTNGSLVNNFKVLTINQRAINEYGNSISGSKIETFRLFGDGSIESDGAFQANSFSCGNLSLANSSLINSMNGFSTGLRFSTGNKMILGPIDYNSSTLNPQGAYSVFITGGLMAEEVSVKLTGDWPDYVFAPDYELMSLVDLELYLIEHRHLPGFEKAELISEQGQNIGENQIKLLEKVEELTLYVIDLNKQLLEAQAEIEALKSTLKDD